MNDKEKYFKIMSKQNEYIEQQNTNIINDIILLNQQGTFVIFAPNHIIPENTFRHKFALADDFPALQFFLKKHEITCNRVVARIDFDIEIGASTIRYVIYKTHMHIMHMVGKHIMHTLPVCINQYEPMRNKVENSYFIEDIISTLKPEKKSKGSNITIYPYGNWYKDREQQFTDKHIEDIPLSLRSPKNKDTFQKWRDSLKVGAFVIAQKTETPIIPCYISKPSGKWYIQLGKPIFVLKTKANEYPIRKAMHEYIASMQELQKNAQQYYI